MENNTNILEPIVDLIIDSIELVCNLSIDCIKTFSKKEKHFNFKTYFENTALFTQTEKERVYPELKDHYNTEQGHRYVFTIPPGYGEQSLNKYLDGLKAAMGVDLESEIVGKFWCVETVVNKLPSNVPYIAPTRSSDEIIIPIGETLSKTISINLKNNPNTFIVGTTGSGKSVCVKSIITTITNLYTPKEVELYLCDLKRVELNLFRDLEHTKEFVYKVEDVTQTIINTLEECEQRYDLFMENNVTNIFEFNKISKNKIPFRILFIEEIILLLQDKNNVGMNSLKQLLSICRASGIYVFISTQRPSTDVLDNVVKANINNRICFKVEDSKNSVICLDDVGAEDLKGQGHGILKVGSVKVEFQGYFISDKQTKDLIKPFINNDIKTNKIKENEIIEDLSFLDKL